MPGWNLKSGIIVEENVSEDEYWSLFNFVFSDACRKTNTYKFGLIKSLCDQVYDLYEDPVQGFYLPYAKLFAKFTENDYSGAAEPPVRSGESHLSGLTEPPYTFCYLAFSGSNP